MVFAEISSMPGTITRLVLPDQSVVWLNAGSRLVYPSVFDEKERKFSSLVRAILKLKPIRNILLVCLPLRDCG